MTPYIYILVITVFAAIAGCRSPKSAAARRWYILAIVLMIACAGLRGDSVGRDYENYQTYFQLSPETVGKGFFEDWLNAMPLVDIGYVYLNSAAKLTGLSFEVLVFLIAVFSLTLYGVFFWKYTEFSAIALMVYLSHAFLGKEMVIIREGMACAISLWAFHYWAAKKFRRATLLIAVSVLLHLGAILIVIPLIAFKLGIEPKIKWVLVSLTLAIVVGSRLSSSFSLFTVFERLAQYQGSESSEALGIFTNLATLKQLAILLTFAVLARSRSAVYSFPVVRLCVLSFWASALWLIAFNQFQILGARGGSFLSTPEPIVVAQIVSIFYHDARLRKFRRIMVATVMCSCLLMMVYDLQIKGIINDVGSEQYKTVFQN